MMRSVPLYLDAFLSSTRPLLCIFALCHGMMRLVPSTTGPVAFKKGDVLMFNPLGVVRRVIAVVFGTTTAD
jgi:hypothetical protein